MGSSEFLNLYFSDYFDVKSEVIEDYGAFNISLLADLPLFVDPFLLFNSQREDYRHLHDEILEYVGFLRDKAAKGPIDPGLLRAWYHFPEVKQNWFGFSLETNQGLGLGAKFAKALHKNLNGIFTNFGDEEVTESSHLEKLCLIESGVGKDKISDFTCNLILNYLAQYTESFAQEHVESDLRRLVSIPRARFNYSTETWEPRSYELPWYENDHVLLTPIDMLTKDDTWISRDDLIGQFSNIPDAVPNVQLRAQINNYFRSRLPRKPTKKDRGKAANDTITKFPELIDYYIRYKEMHAEDARSVSAERLEFSIRLYTHKFRELALLLKQETNFYGVSGKTYDEARARALYFKDVIENKGGYRLFWSYCQKWCLGD